MEGAIAGGLRVGVVGVGRIGVLHARTVKENTAVRELVIADANPVRAREIAVQIGATVVDAGQLFLSGLDALVIAASTASHAGLVTSAVAAGVPVFCEKPLAGDVRSTIEVLERVESAGASLTMGFQRRSDAGYRAAREAVVSGRLGAVHTLYAATFDPTPPPAAYIATSGGIFRDMLIHDFDIVRFVTGREVVRVSAAGANKGDAFFAAAGDVDTAGVVLTFDDGTIAVVNGGRYNGAGYDVRLEVHGRRGTIVVGLDDRVPLLSAEPGAIWPRGVPYPSFFERFASAYRAEIDNFIDHVLGKTGNPSPPRDALEALYIAEAAQLSLDRGGVVEVEEVR